MRISILVCLSAFLATTFAHAADVPTIPPDQARAAAALKESPRHGEYVEISLAGESTKLKSFVVYPERSDPAPVVLVIHEIFGLSDWVRAVCDQLAADGFIAIAPDMLSGMGKDSGGTESFEADKVRDAIRALTPEIVTKRLNATRDYATKLQAASGKSASIGFCWGGGMSFAYAAQQPALSGAVVYYGPAPAASEMEKITCPVLGLYGKDDARITSTVESTRESMEKLGKSYEPIVYDGAGHGFLRQQNGREGANLKASEAAWSKTIQFLKDVCK